MPVARLALAGVLATAALALTGCGEESESDNSSGARGDAPAVEPTIIRTPVRVSDAPSLVPQPGQSEEHGEAHSE